MAGVCHAPRTRGNSMVTLGGAAEREETFGRLGSSSTGGALRHVDVTEALA
ncbi:MAG: hypothetical protein SFW67_08895 [Myxococcaceae bacterium]|nr:hypothetical protein [Myxococcaceae bacterium]